MLQLVLLPHLVAHITIDLTIFHLYTAYRLFQEQYNYILNQLALKTYLLLRFLGHLNFCSLLCLFPLHGRLLLSGTSSISTLKALDAHYTSLLTLAWSFGDPQHQNQEDLASSSYFL